MAAPYLKMISEVLNRSTVMNYPAAVLAYIFMIFGLYYFAVRNAKTRHAAAVNGALFGLVVFGVYDATFYTFMPVTNMYIGLVDVLWGTVLCCVSAYLSKITDKA